jgi:lysophospholipase L1-like esterase
MTPLPLFALRRSLVAAVVPLVALAGFATAAPAAAAPAGRAGSSLSSRAAGPTAIVRPAPVRPGPAFLGPVFREPRRYLLSLGDSLGFGYQAQRVSSELASGTYSPDHFPGYVQPFEADVQQLAGRGQTVVNYACPGETTGSMISGPCAFAGFVHSLGYPRALHDDYPGAQLSAAVAFLAAHPAQVSPITVSLGANDLNNLFTSCQQDVTCVRAGLPGTLTRLATNLSTVLDALRRQAPRAQIIVLTPYNPAYVLDPATDPLLLAGDLTIAAVATTVRARVADGFGAINGAIPGQERTSVCTYTLMCTQGDIHPSDAGYLRLAGALWAASSYGRPAERHAAA